MLNLTPLRFAPLAASRPALRAPACRLATLCCAQQLRRFRCSTALSPVAIATLSLCLPGRTRYRQGFSPLRLLPLSAGATGYPLAPGSRGLCPHPNCCGRWVRGPSFLGFSPAPFCTARALFAPLRCACVAAFAGAQRPRRRRRSGA